MSQNYQQQQQIHHQALYAESQTSQTQMDNDLDLDPFSEQLLNLDTDRTYRLESDIPYHKVPKNKQLQSSVLARTKASYSQEPTIFKHQKTFTLGTQGNQSNKIFKTSKSFVISKSKDNLTPSTAFRTRKKRGTKPSEPTQLTPLRRTFHIKGHVCDVKYDFEALAKEHKKLRKTKHEYMALTKFKKKMTRKYTDRLEFLRGPEYLENQYLYGDEGLVFSMPPQKSHLRRRKKFSRPKIDTGIEEIKNGANQFIRHSMTCVDEAQGILFELEKKSGINLNRLKIFKEMMRMPNWAEKMRLYNHVKPKHRKLHPPRTSGYQRRKQEMKRFVGDFTDFKLKAFKSGTPGKRMRSPMNQTRFDFLALMYGIDADSVQNSKQFRHQFQQKKQNSLYKKQNYMKRALKMRAKMMKEEKIRMRAEAQARALEEANKGAKAKAERDRLLRKVQSMKDMGEDFDFEDGPIVFTRGGKRSGVSRSAKKRVNFAAATKADGREILVFNREYGMKGNPSAYRRERDGKNRGKEEMEASGAQYEDVNGGNRLKVERSKGEMSSLIRRSGSATYQFLPEVNFDHEEEGSGRPMDESGHREGVEDGSGDSEEVEKALNNEVSHNHATGAKM